jgi:hypothetical protein
MQQLFRTEFSGDTAYSVQKKRLFLVAYGLGLMNRGNLLHDQVIHQ